MLESSMPKVMTGVPPATKGVEGVERRQWFEYGDENDVVGTR